VQKPDNTTLVEADREWNGYTEADEKVTLPAAFILDFGQLISDQEIAEFGGLISSSSKAFIISSLDAGAHDLTTFKKLVDGARVYQITKVKEFKPGGTSVFFSLEVD
tara:strand:+ start:282 stop:602 length:321 start_codon:yes stop_codon:yes gene_type:complete